MRADRNDKENVHILCYQSVATALTRNNSRNEPRATAHIFKTKYSRPVHCTVVNVHYMRSCYRRFTRCFGNLPYPVLKHSLSLFRHILTHFLVFNISSDDCEGTWDPFHTNHDTARQHFKEQLKETATVFSVALTGNCFRLSRDYAITIGLYNYLKVPVRNIKFLPVSRAL
jgi:hypothetical protein